MKSGVYRWICEPTEELYIGSTVSFKGRRRDHIIDLRKGTHHSFLFQRAWDKYGENAFRFEIMLICVPTDLIFYEQRAIDILEPALNVCKKAGSLYQALHHPEVKARHALRTKEALADPDVNARQRVGIKAAWGRPEIHASQSLSIKEAMALPEEKERKSKASAELMSDPVMRERISEKLKATLALPEMKLQRSQTSSEVMKDPDRRARISIALKNFHAQRKAEAACL